MPPSHPSPCASITLAVGLAIPACLSQIDPNLEIYPAIIFPGGASTIEINRNERTVIIAHSELLRKNGEGTLEVIDPKNLLPNVHGSISRRITWNHFGLLPESPFFRLEGRRIGKHEFSRRSKSNEELAKTYNWLTRELGYPILSPDDLLYRKRLQTIKIGTGVIVDSTIVPR